MSEVKKENIFMKKKVVIIGAGPAGLSAAYELLEKSSDWDVTILELSHDIGGISKTIKHNNCLIDLGPHRFFSKSDEVNAIWNKLMPTQGAPAWDDAVLNRAKPYVSGGPDPEKEDKVMLIRDRLTRIFYLRHFFDYPIAIKFETFWNMGLWRTMKAGMSYLYSAFFKRKENSLEDFYINRFGKVLYSMFFEDYTEKLWGIHPSKISPEWGAQRVKGLSLWKALLNVLKPKSAKRETSLIESYYYPKKGSGQFWEVMADAIRAKGGQIEFGCHVTSLKRENGNVVSVLTESGKEFPCDALFSSMPIKELIAAFDEVPSNVTEVSSALPYRDFVTVGLLVDRLALKNTTNYKTVNDLIPDSWIYIQERDVRVGRMPIFNNFSPYMVDDPSKHVWLELEYFCSETDALWAKTDEEFITFGIDEMKKIGVLEKDLPILDSVCLRVKKAYPAYFGSYARFNEVRDWLDTIPNLYCIGRYNNMDHSMLCGLEAARALLNGTSKADLWNVNTEEEYHESK